MTDVFTGVLPADRVLSGDANDDYTHDESHNLSISGRKAVPPMKA